jgi:hypothetical protein
MKVTEELIVLTAEDIRYARNVDLASLTKFDATAFAAWSNAREISGRNLNAIAQALGMEKHEVLRGIELRKQDTVTARKVQAKLEQLLTIRNTATA